MPPIALRQKEKYPQRAAVLNPDFSGHFHFFAAAICEAHLWRPFYTLLIHNVRSKPSDAEAKMKVTAKIHLGCAENSIVHGKNAVTQVTYCFDVVRDKKKGQSVFFIQFKKKVQDPCLRQDVEQ